jgi:acetylornithine deacetylase/succinyl-diaminopimelate desuccinylase family protein
MRSNWDSIQDEIQPAEVIDLACRLVTIDSQNPPGNEAAVAQALGAYLQAAGFQVHEQRLSPGRSNLVATLCGPADGPALLLCGHSDTMPAGDGWMVHPLGGEVRDGRLYGRGAADMKGGLAAMAVAGAALSRAKIPLRGSLVFAAVIDEENLGSGAAALVESDLRADWAVIAEPTNNIPVIVSNGQINFEVTFHGKAGHGSQPSSGHNAIYDGARFVDAVQSYARDVLPARSHPLVGAASVNVGTFQGGVQTSIIPDLCRITVDRRVAPGEGVEAAIAEMAAILDSLRRADPTLDAEMKVTYCLPPVLVPEDAPVAQALRKAAQAVTGRDPGTAGMRATTDAATLAGKGGIPTVVFGPGSIAQAHKPDEYIELDELVESVHIFARTIVELLGA